MGINDAFRKYGAKLKNAYWSVSAENDSGELVVSLWTHFFLKPEGNKIKYVDKVSRWSGAGNNEFRERIDKAFKTDQAVRAVIARTDNEEGVKNGEDASKFKNTFSIKKDWVGKVILWDGDDFEIEFIDQSRT